MKHSIRRALRPVGMPLLLGTLLVLWPLALALWIAALPVLGVMARRHRGAR